MTQTQNLSTSEITTIQSALKAAMSVLDACGQDDLSDQVKTIFKTVAERAFAAPVTVLPPVNAQSANDLWDIELPKEVEQANLRTHGFGGEDYRCGNCDSRGGGQWARFACLGTPGAITYEAFVQVTA